MLYAISLRNQLTAVFSAPALCCSPSYFHYINCGITFVSFQPLTSQGFTQTFTGLPDVRMISVDSMAG